MGASALAAAVLSTLALALGCSHAEAPTNSLSFDYIGPTGSSFRLTGFSRGTPPRPHVSRELGVFVHSSTPADSLSRSDARATGFFIWNEMELPKGFTILPNYVIKPRRVELDRSRRLLNAAGPKHRPLYAAPTANGWVCYGLVGQFVSARCEKRLDHGITLVIDDRDGPGGSPVFLYGLASDLVRAISIDVGGRLVPVRLGRNAFTLTLPKAGIPAKRIRAVILTRNGKAGRYPLDWSGR